MELIFNFGITLLIILIGFVLFEIVRCIIFGRRAVKAGEQTEPFNKIIPQPKSRILIIGDSTSYGTGASKPGSSLAGQLASQYPDFEIRNWSENSMNIKRLNKKIEELNEQFDFIFIHIGGMDTISFTPLSIFSRRLIKATGKIKPFAKKRIFLVSVNNAGALPFFRWPINKLYSRRSRTISRACEDIADQNNIIHISLFHEADEDPLHKNRKQLMSADNIHPNDEGYRIWFQKINTDSRKYLID